MSSVMFDPSPAQQSQCTIKIKATQPKELRAWTAARCHRLLRPLISRFEVLRKEPVCFVSAVVPTGTHQPPTCFLLRQQVRDSDSRKRASDINTCWDPRKKRIRRTYSTRSKPDREPRGNIASGSQTKNQYQKSVLKAGEILVPTLILKRSKPVGLDNDLDLETASTDPRKTELRRYSQQRCMIKGVEGHFKLAESMRKIRMMTHAGRFKVYEGISDALEALLRATSPQDKRTMLSAAGNKTSVRSCEASDWGKLHSKSLFHMCLRNVSNHIQHVEDCAALEAEETGLTPAFDTGSISAKIYSILESFGSSGLSWRHLKVVVRAHGIKVVKDAIAEGCIDVNFAHVLVMLCIHSGALEEAEVLLTTLLTCFRYPYPESPSSQLCDNPPLLPLLTLKTFVGYTHRESYHHRQVISLIDSSLLPVTWLATEAFSYIWTSVFSSLSNNPSDLGARLFITTALALMCKVQLSGVCEKDGPSACQGVMHPALCATLTSALTTLSAMGLLSSFHTKAVMSLLDSAIIDCKLMAPDLDSDEAALVATGNLLLVAEAGQTTDCAKLLLNVLSGGTRRFTASHYSKASIPAFVCAVAYCCARGSSGDPFQHLKNISQQLEAFINNGVEMPEEKFLLCRIIVDSCFLFAQHQPEQKHLEYAQQVATALQTSHSLSTIPHHLCTFELDVGFRWEEGISEWVTGTPEPDARKIQGVSAASLDHCSDTEVLYPRHQVQKLSCKSAHVACGTPKTRHMSYGRVSDLGPLSPGPCKYEDFLYSPQHGRCGRLLGSLQSDTTLDQAWKMTQPDQCRTRVSKAQKLAHRLVYAGQEWRQYSDSEDELSTECHRNAGVRKLVLGSSRRFTRKVHSKTRKGVKGAPIPLDRSFLDENDDELGLEME